MPWHVPRRCHGLSSPLRVVIGSVRDGDRLENCVVCWAAVLVTAGMPEIGCWLLQKLR